MPKGLCSLPRFILGFTSSSISSTRKRRVSKDQPNTAQWISELCLFQTCFSLKPYLSNSLMMGTLPYLQAYMIGPQLFYEIRFFWILGQFCRNFSSCWYWFYSIQQNILSVQRHLRGLSIICSLSPSQYEVIIILISYMSIILNILIINILVTWLIVQY